VSRFFAVSFVIAVAVPLLAHHSYSRYYFEDRSVTLEGELVQFDYQSPHAWVHIEAKDPRGVLRKYSAEWSNPNQLDREGITKETLKIGDRLIVSGSPGRTPEEYKVHLKQVERPADGWKWPTGRRRR